MQTRQESNTTVRVQTAILCFLSMTARLVVRPMETPVPGGARAMLFMILVHAGVTWLLALPILKKGCRFSGSAAVLPALLLLLDCGRQLLQTETFYRYASYEPLPSLLPVLLLAGIALYTAFCGQDACLRVGELLLGVFLLSVVLLFWASAQNFKLTNLSFEEMSLYDTALACVKRYEFPPEIFLLAQLRRGDDARKRTADFKNILLLLMILCAGLSLSTELALGSTQQAQALQLLARSGGLSVFQRLDAMHVATWTLCAGTRLILFSTFLYQDVFEKRMWPCVLGLAGGVFVAAALPEGWLALSAAGLSLLVWLAVLFPAKKGGGICVQK